MNRKQNEVKMEMKLRLTLEANGMTFTSQADANTPGRKTQNPRLFMFFSIFLLIAIGLIPAPLNNTAPMEVTTGPSKKDLKVKEPINNVSIHINIDPLMKARPVLIYLAKTSEWYSFSENIESERVKHYNKEINEYKFYNIKPDIYWLGISFPVLKKNGKKGYREIFTPAFSTGTSNKRYKKYRDYDLSNMIDLKKGKKVFVNLNIKVELVKRPTGDIADPQGHFIIIKRTSPKSDFEDAMLDENYLFSTLGLFSNKNLIYKNNKTEISVDLVFYFFDDCDFNKTINDVNISDINKNNFFNTEDQ